MARSGTGDLGTTTTAVAQAVAGAVAVAVAPAVADDVTPEHRDRVSHLGTLIGDPAGPRIVAVSTSGVFLDPTLVPAFWSRAIDGLDSGIQGHLYTRPHDVFVLRLPELDPQRASATEVPGPVDVAAVLAMLELNAQIWAELTGVRLATADDPVIISAERPPPPGTMLPPHVRWHVGSLLAAGAGEYRTGRGAFLAFILDVNTLTALGLQADTGGGRAALIGALERSHLRARARATTALMDKNSAMNLLQANRIPCARTYTFTRQTWLRSTGALTPGTEPSTPVPSRGRYVFKPAGGAAGVGVLCDPRGGSSAAEVIGHINELAVRKILPDRFQLQRFVPGVALGASAVIGSRTVRVLEVHEQLLDAAGRFVGARWTPSIAAEHWSAATHIAAGLRTIPELFLRGPISWDMIAGQVIEVNPRLTASAPIAHLLYHEARLRAHRGPGFRLTQIDVNTAVSITPGDITRLRGLIDDLWRDFGVLVLPQGLNPFGTSRCVFVNDDDSTTAQQHFLAALDVPTAQ
ncbi:ATP-grasp domain-containing protein [Cryobacterium frigoriphilum]|uniref:ATP-grasp domain-containing protein n=1 Tax=Cryobacterium frigoriphilum TaxID=1259150 RepID=A0A4R9A8Q2_9MICO|nr:ATP-grasp domain-containing protein [Cryobacterium frigoriphilum]TFD53974.1 ATP-grasp domain-containing protein [Cryobacterium frigoriphilum]